MFAASKIGAAVSVAALALSLTVTGCAGSSPDPASQSAPPKSNTEVYPPTIPGISPGQTEVFRPIITKQAAEASDKCTNQSFPGVQHSVPEGYVQVTYTSYTKSGDRIFVLECASAQQLNDRRAARAKLFLDYEAKFAEFQQTQPGTMDEQAVAFYCTENERAYQEHADFRESAYYSRRVGERSYKEGMSQKDNSSKDDAPLPSYGKMVQKACPGGSSLDDNDVASYVGDEIDIFVVS